MISTVVVLPATADSALALLIGANARLGLAMQAARQAADQIRVILNNNE